MKQVNFDQVSKANTKAVNAISILKINIIIAATQIQGSSFNFIDKDKVLAKISSDIVPKMGNEYYRSIDNGRYIHAQENFRAWDIIRRVAEKAHTNVAEIVSFIQSFPTGVVENKEIEKVANAWIDVQCQLEKMTGSIASTLTVLEDWNRIWVICRIDDFPNGTYDSRDAAHKANADAAVRFWAQTKVAEELVVEAAVKAENAFKEAKQLTNILRPDSL